MHSCNPSTQDTEQKDGEPEASLSYVTNEERREGGKRKIFCCLFKYMLESSVNNVIITYGGRISMTNQNKNFQMK